MMHSRRRFMELAAVGAAGALTMSAKPEPSEFASPVIQVGVVTSDLEQSLAFYQDVLGMTRVGGFDLDEDFGRRSGLTGGLPLSVAVLQLHEGDGATQWKLMSFGRGASETPGQHIQDGLGMRYITLSVTSLAPFLERLSASETPLLGETPTELGDGRHFVLVQDPDGVFVELIGPM